MDKRLLTYKSNSFALFYAVISLSIIDLKLGLKGRQIGPSVILTISVNGITPSGDFSIRNQ